MTTIPQRRGRRAGRAFALAAVVAASLVAAVSASAADYTVYSCRGPDGSPVSAAAWRAGGSAGTRTDSCATGGALRFVLGPADTSYDATSGYRLAVEAESLIAGYRIWMAVQTAPTSDASTYGAGLTPTDGLGVTAFPAGCAGSPAGCSAGVLGDPLNVANLTTSAAPSRGLAFAGKCLTPTGCAPAANPAVAGELYRSEIDFEDDTAPAVSAPRGTLIGTASVAGTRQVSAPATDAGGGGVEVSELVVDGVANQTQAGTGDCARPFTVVSPCPRSTEPTFVLDTRTLADGPHQIQVRAIDAAGNAALSPIAGIVVDNRPPPTASAATTSGGTATTVVTAPPVPPSATAVLVKLSVPSTLVRLPAARAVKGRATRADGTPLALGTLRVRSAPLGAPDDELRAAGTIRTAADGTFTLPRTGDSRRLRIDAATDAYVAYPIDVRLVRPLTLSLTKPGGRMRNGGSMTLTGRLGGAGGSGRRVSVVVQAIVHGRWQDVGTATTTSAGKVTWRYRFVNSPREAFYRFRLVAPEQRALPFKRAASREITVHVLPGPS